MRRYRSRDADSHRDPVLSEHELLARWLRTHHTEYKNAYDLAQAAEKVFKRDFEGWRKLYFLACDYFPSRS